MPAIAHHTQTYNTLPCNILQKIIVSGTPFSHLFI